MKPKRGKHYDLELMYGYYREAGGQYQEAMRRAKSAGETRTPTSKSTWRKYCDEHAFAERLRGESKTDWERYHAERQANVQQTLDRMAEGFEMLAGAFLQMIEKEFAAMRSGIDLSFDQNRKLLKFFGSMESIDTSACIYDRKGCQSGLRR